jgi:hypothetical protein
MMIWKNMWHNRGIHLFINDSTPFVGPWSLLQFRNLFTQTVGLLGRVHIDMTTEFS